MEIRTSFEVNGTLVANEFIDRYMAAANGEYVKVYLYLVRHQGESPDIAGIADALDHTESDVRRALSYWEKLGVLRRSDTSGEKSQRNAQETASVQSAASAQPAPSMQGSAFVQPAASAQETAFVQPAASAQETAFVQPAASMQPQTSMQPAQGGTAAVRLSCTPQQMSRLSEDEEFSQLLYIAQKYMNKIFVQRDCEVFAYLYDSLHMNAELLEYLVEYCAQEGHTSLRYVETVALSWHKKGFATAEEARAYTSTFSKNSFAVMRAFGLSDRGPGAAEKEMIERWFLTYGFSKELVLEACSRTLDAIHSPSFRYADKILSEWKKANVRHLSDVAALDEKRQSRSRTAPQKKPVNQFHNFEQRDTDYDSMVLDQVKTWITES